MYDSEEFSNVLEPCFTEFAKGASTTKSEKVFAYRAKRRPQIANILTSIEESNRNRDKKMADKQRHLELAVGDPKYSATILLGKEKLLECLHKLGGEQSAVDLLELQKLYKQEYNEELNKNELKKYFPTGQLKVIMDNFLYEDIDVFTDVHRNGSMLFKMKRSLAEVVAENARIAGQRAEFEQIAKMKTENGDKKKRNKKKKDKEPPPPQQKKLKVIKPPPEPKPKPKPLVLPLNARSNAFYTDDQWLATRIKSARDPNCSTSTSSSSSSTAVVAVANGGEHQRRKGGKEEEGQMKMTTQRQMARMQIEEEEEEREGGERKQQKEDNEPIGQQQKQKRVKYTSRLEGGVYTDSEEEEEEGDNAGDDWEETDEEEESEQAMDRRRRGECSAADEQAKQRRREQVQIEEVEEERKKTQLDLEKFRRMDEQRAEKRLLQAMHRQQQKLAFEQQLAVRNNTGEGGGPVEGVFVETKRFGRRAQTEDERRKRVDAELVRLNEMTAKGDGGGKRPVLVLDRKPQDVKFMVAAQLVWTNHELGLSELRNMLRLLFGDRYADLQMDVPQFVSEWLKCCRQVRAPVEPHLVVSDGCRKDVSNAVARVGRLFDGTMRKL